MSGNLVEALDRRFYPGASRNWDVVRFAELVRGHLRDDAVALDYGAGRGKDPALDFRGGVARVVGVDIDDAVLQNPYVDEPHVIAAGQGLPFDDNSFDLIWSCNVLEHVENPARTIGEILRVLKPAGLFLAKTTNRNHYVAWASRLTPTWFHKYYNQRRGRLCDDTFRTTYRCNSRRQLARIVRYSGGSLKFVEFWEGRPEYLRLSPLTYLGGIAYEKLVNSTRLLAPFRAVMVVGLGKEKRAPRRNAVTVAA